MAQYVIEHFVPVRIHIKERPKDFERFKAEWTPTVILAEADGTERFRFSGYLPPDDFLAELRLGSAKAAFSRGLLEEARRGFDEVASRHANSDAAPEAVYWAGVSDYKASHKPEALKQTGLRLKEKYPQSEWAKKGSVWLG